MTVQELIDVLMEVSDKSIDVEIDTAWLDRDGLIHHVRSVTEYGNGDGLRKYLEIEVQ